jgi:hypothetical protein
MSRWMLLVAATAAGLRWIWNSNEWSGPVILHLSANHGVHLHDWVAPALIGLALLVVRSPQQLTRPVRWPANRRQLQPSL